MNSIFNPEISGQLCLTLLHSLWQVALLVAAVWVVERLLRRQSVERSYGLHVAALILGLAALPITFAVIQMPSQATVAMDGAAIPKVSNAESVSTLGPVVPPSPAVQGTAEKGWEAVWHRFAPWFVGIYASGVVLMFIRLLTGIIRAERLRSLADSIADGPLVQSLQTLSRR